MIEPEKTLLWSATEPAASNSNIELLDSIDNYDEIQIYASATNTFNRYPITEFPVVSGKLMINGPLYFGYWDTGSNWRLANGTRMGLYGNSGTVQSSYYMGKNNSSTAWAASYVNNRVNDIRPIRIYGIKYPQNYDRTLLWESTGNPYNTNITLNETINHFDELLVYGSGFENDANGVKTTKNKYQTQNHVIGIDPWGYTPWAIGQKYNYIVGCEAFVSGTSGYVGSAWCFGMANSTAYGGYRWTGNDAPKMMVPWKIYGVKRRPTHKFKSINTAGGSVSASINPGYSGDIATVTAVPNGDEWKVSALDISGATLTGNEFMYETTDVSAKAEFEHSRDLTLENSEHGVLSADKMSGFSGDVVTVDATTDEGWYLSAIALTGAEATGFKFMFTGSDVTAQGEYTDVGFPITYETDGHGTLTGDPIYIPGSTGVTLQTAYNTYYRFSGYEVTGGTITNNVLVATGPCTARAVYKVNAFTATGGWEKGSDLLCAGDGRYTTNPVTTANLPIKYALHSAHTGDIPASWYSTSNRWNPSNASAYNATLKPIAKLSGYRVQNESFCVATANMVMRVAGANTQAQNITFGTTRETKTYSKNFTTTSQSLYGISGKFNARGWSTTKAFIKYLSSGTTGTWTATGIAP